MRILLTGACGVLGRAIREAAGQAHEFVLLDVAPQVEADGGIRGSFADQDAILRAARGCDAIIHTAAMHGHSYGAPGCQFIQTNVLGAEYLFQAALHAGIRRVVMSSTMEITIGRDWAAYGTAVVDESLPPRPDWVYPLTKLQVEHMGHFYARHHGLEVIQLRYMAFDDHVITNPLHVLARCVDRLDVARANLLAATRPGLKDEVFHIGPDTPLTQQDVNNALEDPWPVLEKYWPGCRKVLETPGKKPKYMHFWPVAPITKAKRMLGWQPQVTFETVLNQRKSQSTGTNRAAS